MAFTRTIEVTLAIAILGFTLTLGKCSYDIGKDVGEAELSFVREQSRNLDESVEYLRAENISLKDQLRGAELRARLPPSESTTTFQSSSGGAPRSSPNVEVVSIGRGETEILFDGELFISLVAISFEGSPLRHRVDARVGRLGVDSKAFEKLDVGEVVEFEHFEVRILSVGTLTITFQASRIPIEPN